MLRNSATLQEAARVFCSDYGTGRRVRRKQTPGGFDRGIEWLRTSRPVGDILPGLYIGELGVAAALVRAGQILSRRDLMNYAATIMRTIAALPHTSPDIFHGTAGKAAIQSTAMAGDPGPGTPGSCR